MRKKVSPLLIAIVCLASLAALGSPGFLGSLLGSVNDGQISKLLFSDDQSHRVKPAPKNDAKTTLTGAEVPDDLIYFVLFKHLVGLKEQAAKESADGLAPVNYVGLYVGQADLTETQSESLFQIAQQCMDAIEPIDSKAKKAIDEARAALPGGEVSQGVDIPPPPAELGELQIEKNSTILSYRDALKESLGAAKFAEFDQFARQKIAPEITGLSRANLSDRKEVK